MNDELLNWICSAPLPDLPHEPRRIEALAPTARWRAWDRDWRQVGEWHERPPSSALVDGGGLTVDYPNGFRKSWRVLDGTLWDERDLMRKMEWPSNPLLAEVGSNP